MNIDEKFPTEKDKIEASEHLKQLIICKGWQIMKDFINEDIEKRALELRTRKFKKEEIQLMWNMQDQLAYLEQLRDLPDELVKILKTEEPTKEDIEIY